MSSLNSLLSIDDRVQHKFSDVTDNITYHYILATPETKPVATVVLLHGWPDLSLGWRYQIPYLLSLNLQVIVPDLLGYGQTSTPQSFEEYTMKKVASHIKQIAKEITDDPVIVGGHDWGAFLAWRMAMYFPELVRAVFAFSVPYIPPNDVVLTLEQIVEHTPAFKYQLQMASGDGERMASKTSARLRGFLNTMYGGVTSDGLPGFDPYVGIIESRLEDVTQSPLVAPDVLDIYVREYSRSGLQGVMNWYRTTVLNAQDELEFATAGSTFTFKMPAMLVMAGQDAALPPSLADGQEKFFEAGLKREVIHQASHWILIHCPEEANAFIGEFIKQVLE